MKSVVYEKEILGFLKPYLSAEEMQRLKHVDMNCGMNFTSVPLFQGIDSYSRYAHSLGVALIVYHFTKDPVQTLAGLFHDISTPAFSHVIDFMNGDALKQESTEDLTRTFLSNSHIICQQLSKDQISLEQVADYHQYPIADNDSPRLSADRLEYTLGAAIDYRFADKEALQPLYDDICVGTNEEGVEELVFAHQKKSVQFAAYALQNGQVFSSKEDRCCMQQLAMLVQRAMQEGILQKADLYTEESKVIAKLETSTLKEEWHAYQKITQVAVSKQPIKGWIQIAAKKRYIDPYCTETKCRVSQFDMEMKQKMNAFLEQDHQEWMKGIK